MKTVLPFELPAVTFVSVSAEDLSVYGPILFKYAFSFARQHMPAAVVLEDMHHQVCHQKGSYGQKKAKRGLSYAQRHSNF